MTCKLFQGQTRQASYHNFRMFENQERDWLISHDFDSVYSRRHNAVIIL